MGSSVFWKILRFCNHWIKLKPTMDVVSEMEALKENLLNAAKLLLELHRFYRAQCSGSLWSSHTIRPPPRCLTALHQTQTGLSLFVSIETAVCGKRWSEKEEQRQTGNNSWWTHCDIRGRKDTPTGNMTLYWESNASEWDSCGLKPNADLFLFHHVYKQLRKMPFAE